MPRSRYIPYKVTYNELRSRSIVPPIDPAKSRHKSDDAWYRITGLRFNESINAVNPCETRVKIFGFHLAGFDESTHPCNPSKWNGVIQNCNHTDVSTIWNMRVQPRETEGEPDAPPSWRVHRTSTRTLRTKCHQRRSASQVVGKIFLHLLHHFMP